MPRQKGAPGVAYRSFEPGVDPNAVLRPDAICFVFRSGELLIGPSIIGDFLPLYEELSSVSHQVLRANYMGVLDGRPAFAMEVEADAPDPLPFAFEPLRGTFGTLDEGAWLIAGRAAMIVDWDRSHQYCGHCGHQTYYLETERAKRCPNCGLVAYPRVSPAVIVLVERGEQVLLARSVHQRSGMYALISGFVDAGEDLVEAVERELQEEVGIAVEDVRFFGSQPWPFPHSLMVGFTAQWKSGEIHIKPDEIAAAQFFAPDDLPPIPPRLSIARKLIDYYAEKHGIALDAP
jgi:NAD+ diphosphatase